MKVRKLRRNSDVSSVDIVSHPNPAISPLELFRREGNLNSIGDATSHRLVRPIDFSAINDTREFTRWCDISYLTRLVKYAATVLNCPEGERCEDGRSCQATNHTGKPNTMRYLAPVSQGLVSCQRQSATMMTLLPSFLPPSPVYFIIFLLFFPPILFDSTRSTVNWIEFRVTPELLCKCGRLLDPMNEFPASRPRLIGRRRERREREREVRDDKKNRGRGSEKDGYRGEDGGATVNRSGSIWLIKLASSLRRGTSYWAVATAMVYAS